MIILIATLSDDYQCLMDFYKATDGDNWTKKNNWDRKDVCSFYGITCDDNNNIVTISMDQNNIRGTLPECFSKSFSEITKIVLMNNPISGLYVPHRKLTFLNLYKTKLDVDVEKLEGVPLQLLDLDHLKL